MPACLQALSTSATCWSSPWPSPRTSTPRVFDLTSGGGQPGGQFRQRDVGLVERDRAVAIDVDGLLLGGAGQFALIGHLRHLQIDLPLVVQELGVQDEEDDQEEHDVEHGRQVQHGLFVGMGL